MKPGRLSLAALLDSSRYLTLATADGDGRPWVSPVWFTHRNYREFFWASRPTTRHSVNLRERPEVSIVVYDSSLPPEQRQAVFVDAVAGEVPDAEVATALALYNARLVAGSMAAWTPDRVTGSGPFRLYVAIAQERWMLHEDSDERVPVGL